MFGPRLIGDVTPVHGVLEMMLGVRERRLRDPHDTGEIAWIKAAKSLGNLADG